jgi:hypothetical protein
VGRGKCRHRDRYPIGKDHHGKGRGQAKERRHMRPELEYPDSTKQPDHRNGGDGGGYGHATERVIIFATTYDPAQASAAACLVN